jgi:hypothetical protein
MLTSARRLLVAGLADEVATGEYGRAAEGHARNELQIVHRGQVASLDHGICIAEDDRRRQVVGADADGRERRARDARLPRTDEQRRAGLELDGKGRVDGQGDADGAADSSCVAHGCAATHAWRLRPSGRRTGWHFGADPLELCHDDLANLGRRVAFQQLRPAKFGRFLVVRPGRHHSRIPEGFLVELIRRERAVDDRLRLALHRRVSSGPAPRQWSRGRSHP